MNSRTKGSRYPDPAASGRWQPALCLPAALCLAGGVAAFLVQLGPHASLSVAGPALVSLAAALFAVWGVLKTRRAHKAWATLPPEAQQRKRARSLRRGRVLRLLLAAGFLAVLLSFLPAYAAHIRNQGQLVFTAASAVGLLGCALWEALAREKAPRRPLRIAGACFAALYGALALAVLFLSLCMFAGTLGPEAPDGATALVLGSKVSGETPSLDLQARIDRAAAWLRAHPSSKAIACGGQGANETISEAEAIRRGLAEQGIAPGRILLEDRSTSTEENIRNAKALLPAGTDAVAVLTDDYHVFRGRLLAEKAGLAPHVYPVPAKTPAPYFPAFYARELLALPVELMGLHGLFT